MMYCSIGAVIRLCWLLSLIFPIVQCQFLSNDAIAAKIEEMRAQGLEIASELDGTIADRLTDALRGNGEEGRQQNGRVLPTEGEETVETAPPTEEPTTLPAAIPETTAPPSVEAPSAEPPSTEPLSTAPPVAEPPSTEPLSTIPPSTAPPSSLQAATPSSVSAFVFPESSLSAAIPTPEPATSSLITPIVPISSATALPIAFDTSLINAVFSSSSAITAPAPSTSSLIDAVVSSVSATSTTTVSTTVLVSPSPDPVPAEENSTPAAPSESSSAEAEPLVATSDTGMSPMAMAGMGVGVAFGLLSIAGVAGFYLWRRRKSHQSDDNTDKPEENSILGKLFGLKKYKDNRGDPEWSIDSAEKVVVGKNMRAQSVSTAARTNSRGSDDSKPGAGSVGVNPRVVPPRRKLSLPNTALGSHPVTPDFASFPVPPTTVDGRKAGESTVKEERKSNWPLSE